MAQRAVMPACDAQPGRRAERVHGTVDRGNRFVQTTLSGWIVRLVPAAEGWLLQITVRDRESEDLARLTPPWHFVPNPREIDGWHFRNSDNTAPNDGSVNAPQELREFIFSPAVGRELEYNGSNTPPEAVERVQSYGRGWIYIESYRLTPPRRGERASFETLTFSACLTWPVG
jgi:hypothetical protein